MSYYCAFLEFKELSAAQHGIAAKRLYVRCVMNGEDIVSGVMTGKQSVSKTKIIRNGFV